MAAAGREAALLVVAPWVEAQMAASKAVVDMEVAGKAEAEKEAADKAVAETETGAPVAAALVAARTAAGKAAGRAMVAAKVAKATAANVTKDVVAMSALADVPKGEGHRSRQFCGADDVGLLSRQIKVQVLWRWHGHRLYN